MLHVQTFTCNLVQEHTYLVYNDAGDALVIDAGFQTEAEQQDFLDFLNAKNLRPILALQTHAHFDHIFGADFLYKTFGLQLRIHPADHALYHYGASQIKRFMHRDIPLELPPLGPALADEEVIPFGDTSFRILHTPGHTQGGVCIYNADNALLFSGDSLFAGTIGRCDLEGGNLPQLIESLKTKLLLLPDDTHVLPGHDRPTTIGTERKANPYLQ